MPWLRCSRAAVQPTQKRISASGFSARVGTSSPSAQSVRENWVPRQGWPRCSMLRRAFIPVSGMRDSSSTRFRRRSMMVGICSTTTGHSSMQAPQETQSQIICSGMAWSMIGSGSTCSGSRGPWWPMVIMCSLIFSTMCMGDRILPVVLAGQASVQRPQTAQAYPSSNCFQVKSCTLPAPKRSAFSRSMAAMVPRGSRDRK